MTHAIKIERHPKGSMNPPNPIREKSMSQAIRQCIESLRRYAQSSPLHWRHHRKLAAALARDLEGLLVSGNVKGCLEMVNGIVTDFRTRPMMVHG